jgi:hypothetical protein
MSKRVIGKNENEQDKNARKEHATNVNKTTNAKKENTEITVPETLGKAKKTESVKNILKPEKSVNQQPENKKANEENLVDKLIKQLITIKNQDKYKMAELLKFDVQAMLKMVYDIYTSEVKVEFTQNQCKAIGCLVKDVIYHIDSVINHMAFRFEHNEAAWDLIVRSGLQFMLDKFKDFPVSKDSTLSRDENCFKWLLNKKTGCIPELDDRLKAWKKSHTPLSLEDFTYTAEEINRPKVRKNDLD